MEHIRETAKTFPFLYYQRIFIRGYAALAVPLVMPAVSDLANGYIYIRRHVQGLRIRDLDNLFLFPEKGGQPIGVQRDPFRGLTSAVSIDVRAKGRAERFTWLYTKDDLPQIINNETHTEFLVSVPVKNPNEAPVGNFNLIRTCFSNFIDWYRIVTGDVSITGPDHWNSHIPMHSETVVDITRFGDRPIDEVVAEVYPEQFGPRIFHFDLDSNEVGTVNATADGISHEQRIAHHLAIGQRLPEVHRRIADIVHLVQETKDWALPALAMFPVFEQYLDAFFNEVGTRSARFGAFTRSKYSKRNPIYVGDKIKWLPSALKALGFKPASVVPYFRDLESANQERIQVVHYNKRPTSEEARDFVRILTNSVLLCETALGNPSPYVVALEKLDA